MSDTSQVLAAVIEPAVSGFWGEDFRTSVATREARVVRNGDVAKNGRIDAAELPVRWFSDREIEKAQVLPSDIILVSSGAYTGNVGRVVGISAGDVIVASNFVRRLRPKPSIPPDWLYYVLRSGLFQERVGTYVGGSAMPNLAGDIYGKLRIPKLAPETLDAVALPLTKIDLQIEQTEALIAKQEQVRAGLMQDLFTRGIDKFGRLRPLREEAPELYQETDWGWMPKAWEVPSVSAIADVVRGSTPRPAKDPRYFDGHFVPWITVGELSREDWPYLEATTSGLTELGSSFSRFLPAGTLVISNSGYGCGVPKILNIGGCANDGVAAFFNLSDDCHTLFLYYWLYLNIENLRLKVARGNDQPNLNTDMIGALRVPKPAFSEQEEIAERIWSIQQAMRRERETSEKLNVARAGLMQDLLTGKVPVDPLLKERAVA